MIAVAKSTQRSLINYHNLRQKERIRIMIIAIAGFIAGVVVTLIILGCWCIHDIHLATLPPKGAE